MLQQLHTIVDHFTTKTIVLLLSNVAKCTLLSNTPEFIWTVAVISTTLQKTWRKVNCFRKYNYRFSKNQVVTFLTTDTKITSTLVIILSLKAHLEEKWNGNLNSLGVLYLYFLIAETKNKQNLADFWTLEKPSVREVHVLWRVFGGTTALSKCVFM